MKSGSVRGCALGKPDVSVWRGIEEGGKRKRGKGLTSLIGLVHLRRIEEGLAEGGGKESASKKEETQVIALLALGT
jgi:hypothetical protein